MKLFQKLTNQLKQYKSTQGKYHLNGKEIKLTSDDIAIKSTNFSVDKDGNMTCANANITEGEITLKSSASSYSDASLKIYDDDGTKSYMSSRCLSFEGDSSTSIPDQISMDLEENNPMINVISQGLKNMSQVRADGITTPEITLSEITLSKSFSKVLSSGESANYVGSGKEYSGITTNLRGNTVRIYSHESGAVYLGSSGSTAVTSDENLKDLYEIDDRYVEFFKNLKPVAYIYKNKGHRNHMGFGARQVEEALIGAGLTTEQFAGVLKDKDVTISADEMGTEEDVHFDELYSLRYEEFIALNTMMIQKQAKQIEELTSRIEELEKEVLNGKG